MDIFVVEGYEMTGKSTFIKKYLSDYAVYRPNYEGYDFDKYIPRNSRSLLGIELLNFIRNNPGVINKGVVLDRSLPSGIVYSKLYPFNGTPIDKKDIEKLVEIYKDVNAKIIYLYHPDSEYARKMYEASLKDSDHSDIYDKFESFGMYWGKYREALLC